MSNYIVPEICATDPIEALNFAAEITSRVLEKLDHYYGIASTKNSILEKNESKLWNKVRSRTSAECKHEERKTAYCDDVIDGLKKHFIGIVSSKEEFISLFQLKDYSRKNNFYNFKFSLRPPYDSTFKFASQKRLAVTMMKYFTAMMTLIDHIYDSEQFENNSDLQSDLYFETEDSKEKFVARFTKVFNSVSLKDGSICNNKTGSFKEEGLKDSEGSIFWRLKIKKNKYDFDRIPFNYYHIFVFYSLMRAIYTTEATETLAFSRLWSFYSFDFELAFNPYSDKREDYLDFLIPYTTKFNEEMNKRVEDFRNTIPIRVYYFLLFLYSRDNLNISLAPFWPSKDSNNSQVYSPPWPIFDHRKEEQLLYNTHEVFKQKMQLLNTRFLNSTFFLFNEVIRPSNSLPHTLEMRNVFMNNFLKDVLDEYKLKICLVGTSYFFYFGNSLSFPSFYLSNNFWYKQEGLLIRHVSFYDRDLLKDVQFSTPKCIVSDELNQLLIDPCYNEDVYTLEHPQGLHWNISEILGPSDTPLPHYESMFLKETNFENPKSSSMLDNDCLKISRFLTTNLANAGIDICFSNSVEIKPIGSYSFTISGMNEKSGGFRSDRFCLRSRFVRQGLRLVLDKDKFIIFNTSKNNVFLEDRFMQIIFPSSVFNVYYSKCLKTGISSSDFFRNIPKFSIDAISNIYHECFDAFLINTKDIVEIAHHVKQCKLKKLKK